MLTSNVKTKVKIFNDYTSYKTLEDTINDFARLHKIVNCSICVSTHGYSDYYTAVVTYEC